MDYKDSYYDTYKNLPEILVALYPELNFKNHCYLRISLDNTFKTKWDTRLKRPAYKNLNRTELGSVLEFLNKYKTDKNFLLLHNKNSLRFRKEVKEEKEVSNQISIWDNNSTL